MGTKHRLKAGVLPFVLAISLVLALVCSAAILLTYYHRISFLQGQINKSLRNNVLSGLQYGLASLPELPEKEWIAIDLYGNGQDSVKIRKESWGFFHIIEAEALRGRHRHYKVALTGAQLPEEKPVLYLEDKRRPLSIAGDTKISGDARLPKAGIKADYVNRIGYRKAKLVYGKILESQPEMPEPKAEMLNQLKELSGSPGRSGQIPPLYNSFQEREFLSLSYPASFVLKDSLSGKILLKSEKEIVVRKEAYVKDVILFAPKIRIERGFEGQLQAFATDTLIVGKEVRLHYPSALGLLADKSGSLIEIQENAHIEGVIFHESKNEGEAFHLLKMAEGSQVLGEVWAKGFVELRGEISGTLSCGKFYLHTPASIYENYIFNGKIEREKLPSFYVSSALLNPEAKRNYVKWLY